MKHQQSVYAFLIPSLSLLLAGIGRAHGNIDHARFRTVERETKTSALDATDGELSVKWKVEIKEPTKPIVEYTLTFTRDPKSKDAAKPFSLYNLRLQGRLWWVQILEVVEGDVVFLDGDGNRLMNGNQPDLKPKIPRTGVVGDGKADETKVHFLQFTGSDAKCVIRVTSNRPIRGKLGPRARAKILDSHDTMPPPPEPGGEEGEDDGEETLVLKAGKKK